MRAKIAKSGERASIRKVNWLAEKKHQLIPQLRSSSYCPTTYAAGLRTYRGWIEASIRAIGRCSLFTRSCSSPLGLCHSDISPAHHFITVASQISLRLHLRAWELQHQLHKPTRKIRRLSAPASQPWALQETRGRRRPLPPLRRVVREILLLPHRPRRRQHGLHPTLAPRRSRRLRLFLLAHQRRGRARQ